MIHFLSLTVWRRYVAILLVLLLMIVNAAYAFHHHESAPRQIENELGISHQVDACSTCDYLVNPDTTTDFLWVDFSVSPSHYSSTSKSELVTRKDSEYFICEFINRGPPCK